MQVRQEMLCTLEYALCQETVNERLGSAVTLDAPSTETLAMPQRSAVTLDAPSTETLAMPLRSAVTLDAPREGRTSSAHGFFETSVFEHRFSFAEDAAAREAYRSVLSVLPLGLQREIVRIERSHLHFIGRLKEIRIRQNGSCTLSLGDRRIPLSYRPNREEAREMLRAMTHGALYAFRSQMRRGYLTPWEGVRVGIVGEVREEDGACGAVDAPSSFVFRIPHTAPDGGEELLKFFDTFVGTGWLLLSAPGVGKTTALRQLGRKMAGTGGRFVVAVDERGEFLSSDVQGSLDLLRGYPRAEGMEIALRTLGAEVVLVDEIGDRHDVECVSASLLAGVPIVATAHARSLLEAEKRPLLAPLFSLGAFDALSVLSPTKNGVRFCNYIRK